MTSPIIVKPNSVAILGFHDGNAGQIETWFEQVSGYHIACFVLEADKFLDINIEEENKKRVCQRLSYPTKDSFKGRPFIVSLDWLSELKRLGIKKVLPLSPDNRTRLRQIKTCQENGIELASAIHPTVTIMKDAIIEPGVWINVATTIGYKAEIRSGVLIETAAHIEHHNVLERCCQVDPGVVTAGNVTLRECSTVHTGVIIIPRKEIGEDAIVGAGAVVIDNIPPCCTAVGVPARVIKRHDGIKI